MKYFVHKQACENQRVVNNFPLYITYKVGTVRNIVATLTQNMSVERKVVKFGVCLR